MQSPGAVLLLLATAVLVASGRSIDHSGVSSARISGGGMLAFSEFERSYAKTYTSAEERLQRAAVFDANYMRILEHNSKGLSYQLGVNEFADMTWEEFKVAHLGASGQECSATFKAGGNAHLKAAAPPASKDWRTSGGVSPVKNQGHCGSCWTFSTTGALESAHAIAFGFNVSLSEQQLVDCAQAFNTAGCNGGLPSHAFEYIKYNGGLDTEAAYPYKAVDDKCHYNPAATKVHVKGEVNVTQGDEAELVAAVGLVKPTSVAFEVVDDFRFYKSGVYTSTVCKSDPLSVNHAVLAVGYGTAPAVNGTASDYWIIKNSWGGMWGMGGFFQMERGANMCGVATCASYPILGPDAAAAN